MSIVTVLLCHIVLVNESHHQYFSVILLARLFLLLSAVPGERFADPCESCPSGKKPSPAARVRTIYSMSFWYDSGLGLQSGLLPCILLLLLFGFVTAVHLTLSNVLFYGQCLLSTDMHPGPDQRLCIDLPGAWGKYRNVREAKEGEEVGWRSLTG